MTDLDDILDQYRGLSTPDTFRNVSITQDTSLEMVFDNMVYVIEHTDDIWMDKTASHYAALIGRKYTGDEINRFLQRTIKHESKQFYASAVGLFVTKVIQYSYLRGANDFAIDASALPKKLESFGLGLNGLEKNLLRVHFIGRLGDGAFAKNHFTDIKIEGEVGDRAFMDSLFTRGHLVGNAGAGFGVVSEYSKFTVDGNVGNSCGCQVKNKCRFIINGYVGSSAGFEAKESAFELTSDLVGDECGVGSKDCEFDIVGQVADRMGWRSEKGKFNVVGSVNLDCGAAASDGKFRVSNAVGGGFGAYSKNCEFTSHNMGVAKRMVRWTSRGSAVYHVKENGAYVRLRRLRDKALDKMVGLADTLKVVGS